jgi:hypothetical protein
MAAAISIHFMLLIRSNRREAHGNYPSISNVCITLHRRCTWCDHGFATRLQRLTDGTAVAEGGTNQTEVSIMFRTALLVSLVSLVACVDHGSQMPDPTPTPTPTPMPDNPPPPPPTPKKTYGQACNNGGDCQSGLCVGAPGAFMCSRSCSLQVALDCKDVDAFCVPLDSGQNACYGTIESGNDLDDAIVEIGDSVTRLLTPLNDTDVFQVRLNTLGQTTITATPEAGIDVKIQAFSVLGEPLAIQNSGAAGVAEALQTNVQQIGTHVFVAVTNVGQSTGGFALAVAHVTAAAPSDDMPSIGGAILSAD